ncbi:V-type ATP synthase subunit D [bacterium]|nr:V-type ATP synthase subunit D [bacterium]
MARMALNKSALQKEREQLNLYQRLLPSLELKRMQLTGELKKAEQLLAQSSQKVEDQKAEVAKKLPMLADKKTEVAGLVKIQTLLTGEENVVGVKLPRLANLTFQALKYSLLAKPHWVDMLVKQLQIMTKLNILNQIAQARVKILNQAVRRLTQRVNLFKNILIPQTKQNIQKIRIFLGDAERAAVVRSKLAKAMHIKKYQALQLA